MNLSYSQFIKGEPTHFVEKIWAGLTIHMLITDEVISEWIGLSNGKVLNAPKPGFNYEAYKVVKPKLTTIREDNSGRWRKGMKIHFCVNNRQPNYFRFAPILECERVQIINIVYVKGEGSISGPSIYIDDELFYSERLDVDRGMLKLACCDGFENVNEFLKYFNKNFTGKIIHWTKLKY